MTTLNRIYSLYSESCDFSLEAKLEWRFNYMRSYKAKQIRENVVNEKILS